MSLSTMSLTILAQAAEAPAAGNPAARPFMLDLFDSLQSRIPDWLHGQFGGIQYWQFLAAFLCVLAGLMLKKISDYILENVVLKMTSKTQNQFDDLLVEAIRKPLGVIFTLLGLWAAIVALTMGSGSESLWTFMTGAIQVAYAIDIMWFVFRLVDVLAIYMSRAAQRTDSKLDDQLVPIIRKSLKVFVALLVLIAVLQNLGYNVGSLLAGLGIGGLAVAMAARDTLANFFGGLVIFTDRPFRVGDLISIGDVEGTVEQIGFRSTRVRTPARTLVTIPNSKLVDTAIDNKTAMPMRRERIAIGLTYETSAQQMEIILEDFKTVLRNEPEVEQESVLVRFTGFGESSLNVLILYFTKNPAYDVHSTVAERINLALMRAVESRGLSMAFPARTVYFEGDVARALAGLRDKAGREK
jgi:MscS family membrane protein